MKLTFFRHRRAEGVEVAATDHRTIKTIEVILNHPPSHKDISKFSPRPKLLLAQMIRMRLVSYTSRFGTKFPLLIPFRWWLQCISCTLVPSDGATAAGRPATGRPFQTSWNFVTNDTRRVLDIQQTRDCMIP